MTVYHFVGIKGTGMSPLAQILHDNGYTVQGSDIEKYIFTQTALEERNITILPFDPENIKPGMTVIAGNAFPDTHPEIEKAQAEGLPVVRYHKFLGDYHEEVHEHCRNRGTRQNVNDGSFVTCHQKSKTDFLSDSETELEKAAKTASTLCLKPVNTEGISELSARLCNHDKY
jgi:hypothetical protein